MIKRNASFSKLAGGYLFPEVAKRRREFQQKHPDAKVISLGIGNTTEPIPPHITKAMVDYAAGLGTKEGYSGYGDEQGLTELREKIAKVIYGDKVSADEVFVSDGAKCDIGRIQTLFGRKARVAVQNPAYPVYVDGSVISGAAKRRGDDGYNDITYLPCTAENDFFPDLTAIRKNSIIYFCSPNNPTGKASTREQLQSLVNYAIEKECFIIYDNAYFAFIRDEKLPKTIYDIDGAKKCAIEINSFSKLAGFTGVRLGWSVVPSELKFHCGSSVKQDWNRIMTTLFNGASNIAQAGGLACLDEEGIKETKELVDYYLENAAIMKKALEGENFASKGVQVYFTGDSPYLWVKFPGKKSWDVFDQILEQCNVVTTPGSGFGSAGESFIRFSAFGHRQDVEEACRRLANFKI
ncbi:MAG: LL-diaminopimelate aminotransferase [Treponemataceae bacterium]|nr:LL-diaminopimelate aminotransferase [Treponemataceae bacterium]